MTPVMLLTDGYIANAAEPWKVPDMSSYEPFPVTFVDEAAGRQGRGACPMPATTTLARPWIKPGTPGPRCIASAGSRSSAAPATSTIRRPTHQTMTDIRARQGRSASPIDSRPGRSSCGNRRGKLVIVGWGSTFGPIHQAVRRRASRGLDVSHIHIRHICADAEESRRSY